MLAGGCRVLSGITTFRKGAFLARRSLGGETRWRILGCDVGLSHFLHCERALLLLGFLFLVLWHLEHLHPAVGFYVFGLDLAVCSLAVGIAVLLIETHICLVTLSQSLH